MVVPRELYTNITDMNTRRILYLLLVKPQLFYASEVWSPVNIVQLLKRLEKSSAEGNEVGTNERGDALQRTTTVFKPPIIKLRKRD